ncbi:MAG: DUF6531 domain-containing protein, partial [Nitrosomonas sp.]
MTKLKQHSFIFLILLLSLTQGFYSWAKVTEQIKDSHYMVEEYYILQQDAFQACNNFLTKHGYSYHCSGGGTSLEGLRYYSVGWLWAVNNISMLPFELGIFYYNLNCPNGTQLDNDIGSCVPLNENLNSGSPQICIGNPINAATGNKYAEEQDIAFSTGLGFSRHYNSTSVSNSAFIGTGWSHTYHRSLFINADTVTITRPDGRAANFRLTGSVWVNQQAGGDILVQLSDIDSNPAGWRFIDADDTVELYSASRKLLSITTRSGYEKTLNYDFFGRVTKVTDSTGRALSFTYDGSSRIQTMT